MSNVTALSRSLEQELFALLRGASLECLVCGEFVLHQNGVIGCPECGAQVTTASEAGVQLSLQAG